MRICSERPALHRRGALQHSWAERASSRPWRVRYYEDEQDRAERQRSQRRRDLPSPRPRPLRQSHRSDHRAPRSHDLPAPPHARLPLSDTHPLVPVALRRETEISGHGVFFDRPGQHYRGLGRPVRKVHY